MNDVLEKRHKRTLEKIKILEDIIENKTRELYKEKVALEEAQTLLEKELDQQSFEILKKNKALENAQEQLQLQAEFLNTVFDSLSEAVIVCDENGDISSYNKTAIKLFSIEKNKDFNLFQLVQINEFENKWKNTIELNLEFSKEEFDYTENDKRLSVNRTRAKQANSNKDFFVNVFTDITREYEVDQMKDSFVSSVSHELRTPLTSLIGFSKTLLKDPNMQVETRSEFIGIIYRESNRLKELIESLLVLSRIQAGQVTLDIGEIDINSFISEIDSCIDVFRKENKVQLTSHNKTNNTDILIADRTKLRMIILNLITNAIKFSSTNSEVIFTIDSKPNAIQFSVEDFGMGIPKKDLSNIFDKFYRVYRPGVEIGGTGLGLAIVKDFVEMHGGKITVTSQEGKGTLFSFYIPKR